MTGMILKQRLTVIILVWTKEMWYVLLDSFVTFFIYILYKLLCITACHSNFIPQTEILLPAIADRRTSSKSIQTCIRPRMSSKGIFVQDCYMCTYV